MTDPAFSPYIDGLLPGLAHLCKMSEADAMRLAFDLARRLASIQKEASRYEVMPKDVRMSYRQITHILALARRDWPNCLCGYGGEGRYCEDCGGLTMLHDYDHEPEETP